MQKVIVKYSAPIHDHVCSAVTTGCSLFYAVLGVILVVVLFALKFTVRIGELKCSSSEDFPIFIFDSFHLVGCHKFPKQVYNLWFQFTYGH